MRLTSFFFVLWTLVQTGFSATVLTTPPILNTPSAPVVAIENSVSFQWEASPDETVVGYVLYWRATNNIAITNRLDVGNVLFATVFGISEGTTYQYWVTAYDGTSIESEPSNTVTHSLTNTAKIQIDFFQTNRVTADLSFLLWSSSNSVGPYAIASSIPSTHWIPTEKTNHWAVGILMSPKERYFMGSLSNLWSETPKSAAVFSPAVLGGTMSLQIKKK